MRPIIALIALVSAAYSVASPAVAQPQLGPIVQGNPVGPLERQPTPRPRFVVEGLSFRAHNETGWDRAGSDEVYVVFEDRNNGQRRFTPKFGDVDSGESRTIGRRQRCIAPLEYAGFDSGGFPPSTWRCRAPGEAGGLDFSITLYEEDGWSPMACASAPGQPAYKKNCDDDEIASFRHSYTTGALLTLMPNVGDTHIVTTPTRGGYAFTFRLRRLPGAFDPPPILQ
ncbi:MAG: hypothetical protein K2P58_15615 [Hyphomonadaceae bacterium]|nr:hypothetical protein [Hyphomonadaceae bacterium]